MWQGHKELFTEKMKLLIDFFRKKLIKYHLRSYKLFLLIVGNTKDRTSRNLFRLFQVAIYFVSVVFLINILTIGVGSRSFGDWGDFFGGVLNPLLMFLTFMGLLITIVLQQRELREARKEFEGQRIALDKQQYEMVKQTFDNKFFQMLNSFNNIREYSNIKNDSFNIIQGLHLEISERHHHTYKDPGDKTKRRELSKYVSAFSIVNDQFNGNLKHFCINLFQIIDYVDREAPSSIIRKKYTNIIRAQLSKKELVLLFFNGIGVIKISGEKFKTHIENYSFLEHLDYSDLKIDPGGFNIKNRAYVSYIVSLLSSTYDEKAYGKNKAFISRSNSEKDMYGF